jgi:hypothetical protein
MPILINKLKPALLLLGLLVSASALPSSVLQRPISTITQTSPLVFEGRVAGLTTEQSGKFIYTWVEFEVIEVIKGDYTGSSLSVRYLGGQRDGKRLEVGDMQLPAFGEQGIYFLESLSQLTPHPLRGWGQGHFIIRQHKSGARQVYTSRGERVTGLNAKTADTRRSLNAFRAGGVEVSNAADAEPTQSVSVDQFKTFIREQAQP